MELGSGGWRVEVEVGLGGGEWRVEVEEGRESGADSPHAGMGCGVGGGMLHSIAFGL